MTRGRGRLQQHRWQRCLVPVGRPGFGVPLPPPAWTPPHARGHQLWWRTPRPPPPRLPPPPPPSEFGHVGRFEYPHRPWDAVRPSPPPPEWRYHYRQQHLYHRHQHPGRAFGAGRGGWAPPPWSGQVSQPIRRPPLETPIRGPAPAPPQDASLLGRHPEPPPGRPPTPPQDHPRPGPAVCPDPHPRDVLVPHEDPHCPARPGSPGPDPRRSPRSPSPRLAPPEDEAGPAGPVEPVEPVERDGPRPGVPHGAGARERPGGDQSEETVGEGPSHVQMKNLSANAIARYQTSSPTEVQQQPRKSRWDCRTRVPSRKPTVGPDILVKKPDPGGCSGESSSPVLATPSILVEATPSIPPAVMNTPSGDVMTPQCSLKLHATKPVNCASAVLNEKRLPSSRKSMVDPGCPPKKPDPGNRGCTGESTLPVLTTSSVVVDATPSIPPSIVNAPISDKVKTPQCSVKLHVDKPVDRASRVLNESLQQVSTKEPNSKKHKTDTSKMLEHKSIRNDRRETCMKPQSDSGSSLFLPDTPRSVAQSKLHEKTVETGRTSLKSYQCTKSTPKRGSTGGIEETPLFPPKFSKNFRIPKKTLPNPLLASPEPERPSKKAPETWLQQQSSLQKAKLGVTSLKLHSEGLEKSCSKSEKSNKADNEVLDILEGRTDFDFNEEIRVARSRDNRTESSSKNFVHTKVVRGLDEASRKQEVSRTTTMPVEVVRSATKPVEVPRSATKTVEVPKSAKKPMEVSRAASKLVEVPRGATKPVEVSIGTVGPVVNNKISADLVGTPSRSTKNTTASMKRTGVSKSTVKPIEDFRNVNKPVRVSKPSMNSVSTPVRSKTASENVGTSSGTPMRAVDGGHTPKETKKRSRKSTTSVSGRSKSRGRKRRRYSDDSEDWTPRGRSGGRSKSGASSRSTGCVSQSSPVGVASRTRSRTRSPSAKSGRSVGFSRRLSSDSEYDDDDTDDVDPVATMNSVAHWVQDVTSTPPSPYHDTQISILKDIQQKKAIFAQRENNYVSMDTLASIATPPMPELLPSSEMSPAGRQEMPDLLLSSPETAGTVTPSQVIEHPSPEIVDTATPSRVIEHPSPKIMDSATPSQVIEHPSPKAIGTVTPGEVVEDETHSVPDSAAVFEKERQLAANSVVHEVVDVHSSSEEDDVIIDTPQDDTDDFEIIDIDDVGPVDLNLPFKSLWKTIEPGVKNKIESLEDLMKLSLNLIKGFISDFTAAEKIKTRSLREDQYTELKSNFLRKFNEFWLKTQQSLLHLFSVFKEKDLFMVLRKKMTACQEFRDPQSAIQSLEHLHVLLNDKTKMRLTHHCDTDVEMAAKLYTLYQTKKELISTSRVCVVQQSSAPPEINQRATVPQRTPSRDSGCAELDDNVVAGEARERDPMDESTADDTLLCAQCGSIAIVKCSACEGTYYCSTDCQAVHWEAGHDANCGLRS